MSSWFRGEAMLWKPYWIGGMIGGFISQVLVGLASLAGSSAMIAAGSTVFIYGMWLQVSIWRCAFNVNNVVWGYLGRVSVVLYVSAWVMLLITLSVF